MEIISVILGYDQVYTNIDFVHVATTPLAECPGLEVRPVIYAMLKEKNETM